MINDLRLLLLDQPEITALVERRVFVAGPGISSFLPKIVIHQTGSEEHNDLVNSGDARTLSLDIDCQGSTGQESFELAQIVRLFLKDYSGLTVAGGAVIDAITINAEHGEMERTTQAGQIRQFSVTIDLDVLYQT